MSDRGTFVRRTLAGLSVASVFVFGSRRSAFATGGLDPDLGTPPPLSNVPDPSNPAVRVLLASNVDPARLLADASSATFTYAGKGYRGAPSVIQGYDRRPVLIATLPIDAYLYGVIPLEIGRGWPSAALETQAIVARTYALSHRITGRQYDLVANTADQVWGGLDAESPQTNAAVDATEGQLVTYAGGLASVFYSASCGGHTADASALWGGANLPYLRGVADPYCVQSSPYDNWTATTTVGALVAALGPKAAALGAIQSIALEPPPADLRPGIRIVGALGAAVLSSADARRALGATLVRSSLLHNITVLGDPREAGTALRIEGSGLGHGVGLCQWGARVMAQQGRTPREIVSFYFPGTLVTNE
ncbi:MAG TPA: SpoIID/LytB domain-containing protein [Candidatus Acidoferrales bacterium]|nr:SpoIID/LytB domain-containing protein [Candidatus Acidoferrales bacterium]